MAVGAHFSISGLCFSRGDRRSGAITKVNQDGTQKSGFCMQRGGLSPIDSWNFLQKMRFLDILVLFKLDLDQISFNRVENALATQQLAFLATSIAFHHFVTRACAEIKIFRLIFFPSFFLLFFSFCCRD